MTRCRKSRLWHWPFRPDPCPMMLQAERLMPFSMCSPARSMNAATLLPRDMLRMPKRR